MIENSRICISISRPGGAIGKNAVSKMEKFEASHPLITAGGRENMNFNDETR
jgi:hypothetical protein